MPHQFMEYLGSVSKTPGMWMYTNISCVASPHPLLNAKIRCTWKEAFFLLQY